MHIQRYYFFFFSSSSSFFFTTVNLALLVDGDLPISDIHESCEVAELEL